MTHKLPRLGLFGLLLASTVVSTQSANAQDDDNRRVLRARDVSTVELNEQYMAAARAKRMESIKYLKQLIAEGDFEGDRRAEMLLRLADLYFEQGRDEYLVEMAAFDKKYEQCFNTEGCSPDSIKPENSGSQKWQKSSIKLYKQILSSYPRYSRADEATFYLAQALTDTGEREEGATYFKTLVKQYPESAFVPDSYVNLGEFYFDDGNAYKALTNYKKATNYPDHDKYGFSLYKLAWCYYNVGEYGEAIAKMKSVVSYSSADGAGSNSKLQLQDEALKDLVRFFADAGEIDEAYAYFTGLGKSDLVLSMLKRLAKMYFEQGKWDQAVQTYRRLIAENPKAPEAPGYQAEIIEAYQKMGLQDETFAEIDRLMKDYGKDSAWARANASNTEAIKDAEEMAEKNLRKVAYYHHNRAKKLKGGDEAKQSYAMAYKAYKVYLENFPKNEHAYEVTYSFAELLYKLKKYDEAYDRYMAVVDLDPKGKHSIFCAESAIFAADEMVKQEGGDVSQGKKDANSKEAQPLTDWEQRMVDACAKFAALYPDEQKVKNIIYKSGYLLYNKYQFEMAAEQFNLVIKMDPQSKEAEQAANLILDSFVVNEDWANLKKNSKFYYDEEKLGSAKFKTEVYEVYQKASLKIIEVDFEANKNHGATADALMAFYKEFPESTENPRVLNNASIYYHTANRIKDAMATREILVNDAKFGPKTKYYYDQLGGLAYDYETIANFSKAADLYEKMFQLYPKERDAAADDEKKLAITTKAKDAIFSAAVFRKAMGEWEAAVSNYKQFIAEFPDEERVTDVKLTIGRTYEENERWKDAAGVYYAFYTQAGPDTGMDYTYFARLHYAQALEKQGQDAKAKAIYEETVKAYAKFMEAGGEPGAYTEFVAEMMFRLAQPKFDEYMKAVIGGVRPGASKKQEDKQVGDSLKAKAALFRETEKLYTDVLKTGAGEWGLASLVKLGQVYENMSQSLLTSHVPSYLTSEQAEMYRMAMEDQAFPQQEKAVAAYKAALDKAYELTLYNSDTALANKKLGELRPNDFPGLQEELPEVQLTSQNKRSFDFETTYE